MATETDLPRSLVPIPDPTAITTQQIASTKQELREEFRALLAVSQTLSASERNTLIVRLDAMDKASVILSENITRVPTLLDREITRVVDMLARSEQLMDEKFTAVAQQFRERDIRSDQDKSASGTAISAALSSLKELIALQNTANSAAIGKSDASTIKQMDGIVALLASNNNALNDKISVINGRLDRGEGGNSAHSASTATMISIAAVAVALFVGLFTVFGSHQSGSTLVSPAVVPLNH
jgi:hypothetical protein